MGVRLLAVLMVVAFPEVDRMFCTSGVDSANTDTSGVLRMLCLFPSLRFKYIVLSGVGLVNLDGVSS